MRGDSQLDVVAYAIRTIIGGNTRQNATVGSTGTRVFGLGKGDDARIARIVCNHQDIILSCFWQMVIDCAMTGLVMVLAFFET